MKRKLKPLVIATLLILCISSVFAQDFDKIKDQMNKNFEAYERKVQMDFNRFVEANDKMFTEFLQNAWKEVDLLVDGITVLPWREKLMSIIKIVPTKQMLIYNKRKKIRDIKDLNGKKIAMVRDSSMEYNLLKIKKRENIDFEFVYTKTFSDMEEYVSNGKADCTVYDSDRAYTSVYTHKNLTIGFPLSSLEVMGWGIKKDNIVLKSILEKYLKYALENRILDFYWEQSYGITFREYLLILDY